MEANTYIKRNNRSILTGAYYPTNIKKVIAFTFLIGNLGFGQTDKILHFSAGSAISGLTYELTKKNENAVLYSIAAGTIAGIAKETYDKNRTGFDNKDLAYTIIGSITINIFRDALTKAKTHRKPKRFHSKMYE